jgi:hypothetical protein
MSLLVKTTLLSALTGRMSPHGFRRSEIKHRRNIRFYDSQSAMLWNELSAAPALSLVPVSDIGKTRLTSEVETLSRIYTGEPPYVFVHVSVTEGETDGVVVWAVRHSCEWTLLHAVASAPIADTITAVALALPVKAVHFVWDPQRLSLAKHYLLRCFGKRTAVPLDTMWLIECAKNGKNAPKVLIRCAP